MPDQVIADHLEHFERSKWTSLLLSRVADGVGLAGSGNPFDDSLLKTNA